MALERIRKFEDNNGHRSTDTWACRTWSRQL